ncbi:MAG: Uma2 family endonuclease [Chloroflexaceae bacterium]
MFTAIDIAEIIARTDASKAPVRLEYVRGHMKWEASPASRHQKALQRIERSLRPIPGHPGSCACFALADTLIRFNDPDRSIKRPDLAIFCVEPPDTDEALDIIPAAVVEVLSLGYEEKDLGPDGSPFYLAYGVQDVVMFDPRTAVVYHDTRGRDRCTFTAPVTLDLCCGCRVTVT